MRCLGPPPVLLDGLEIDVPEAVEPALLVDEVEQAAAQAAHRRDVELARADRLAEGLVEKLDRPRHRRRRVVHLQRDGADRRAVGDVEGMGEALLVGVDDEVDAALAPAVDRLGLVLPRLGEAEAAQDALELLGRPLVHGELDELDAAAARARRQLRQARHGRAGPAAKLVEEEAERALAVDGDAAGGAGPEAVVEDLEREQAVEAGRREAPP